MDKKTYLEQILAYEASEPSREQQQVFELALSEDADFKSFYEDWESSKTMQDILAYDEVRSKIRKISDKQVVRKYSFKRHLSIAASILVLAMATGVFFANNNYSNESISEAYYQAPNFSVNRDVVPVSNLEKAKVQFGSQNYSEVIELLENTTNTQELYLLGHALYQNNSFNEAAGVFKKLIPLNDTRVSIDSEWFYAISMLNGDETIEAKAILLDISKDEEHPYQEDAEKMLQLLESKMRFLVF